MVAIGSQVAVLDLELYQGEDFRLPLEFDQNDGTPIDLSQVTAIANIVRNFKAVAARFAIEIHQDTVGQLILSLSQAQTLLLKPASYSWDLFLIDNGGKVSPRCKGTVLVYPSSLNS